MYHTYIKFYRTHSRTQWITRCLPVGPSAPCQLNFSTKFSRQLRLHPRLHASRCLGGSKGLLIGGMTLNTTTDWIARVALFFKKDAASKNVPLELTRHRSCDECSICLGSMGIFDSCETFCEHRFHTNCLSIWTSAGNTTCPLCRGPVFETEPY